MGWALHGKQAGSMRQRRLTAASLLRPRGRHALRATAALQAAAAPAPVPAAPRNGSLERRAEGPARQAQFCCCAEQLVGGTPRERTRDVVAHEAEAQVRVGQVELEGGRDLALQPVVVQVCGWRGRERRVEGGARVGAAQGGRGRQGGQGEAASGPAAGRSPGLAVCGAEAREARGVVHTSLHQRTRTRARTPTH